MKYYTRRQFQEIGRAALGTAILLFFLGLVILGLALPFIGR
jgi:hypothetical protein